MTSRPIPTELQPWAQTALGLSGEPSTLQMVAGDASNRRYFRLPLASSSYIVAESPPSTEKNAEFVSVQHRLSLAGVRVPALYAADLERGFLLLEDLGDTMLLSALDSDSVDVHYRRAFELLRKMADRGVIDETMPTYDRALLSEELSRFDEWFVEGLLGHTISDRERDLIRRFGECLLVSALEQPRVLVHRDFHSRNLMLLAQDELAVIDFQDTVVGPVTYDLASLLKDCYIYWPTDRVRHWALAYRESLPGDLLDGVTPDQFLRWFDWMGLERHIKVLGTFARLYLRDGKVSYLQDLPLVLRYVEEVLQQYAGQEPVFAEFQQWFNEALAPLIARQSWSAAP
ncbi:MAG: phosphotransferase [Halioglobus sp.]